MTAAETDRVVQRTNMRIFFDNCEEFDFALLYSLSHVTAGAAEIGECLRAVQDVGDYDYDGWRAGWKAIGETVLAEAEADAAAGRTVSARAGYLRAWNYLNMAEFWLTHGTPERFAAREESVAAFEKAAALPGPEFRKLEIPFEDKTLPGWFFPAQTGVSCRTIIAVTGTDGLSEQAYITMGGPKARERGWNVLAFDGPGQLGAVFHDASLVWRPDYDNVMRAVVDFARTVPEVDVDRLAVFGESAGGWFAPKGVTGAPEVKALIVNPPVIDYRELILPPVLRLRDRGGRTQEAVEALMTWTFGVDTLEEVAELLHQYVLQPGEIEALRCAALLIAGEGEGPMGEQLEPFYERLTGVKAKRVFTEAEGGDAHGILNNQTLMRQAIYDWLDTVVPAPR